MFNKSTAIAAAGLAALTLGGCSRRAAINVEHLNGHIGEAVAAAAHKNQLGGSQADRFDAHFERSIVLEASLKDVQLTEAGDYNLYDRGFLVRSLARYWAITTSNGKSYLLAATNPDLPTGEGNAEVTAVLDQAAQLSRGPYTTSKQANADGSVTHRFLTLNLLATVKNAQGEVATGACDVTQAFDLTPAGDRLFGVSAQHQKGSVEEQTAQFFLGGVGTVISVRRAEIVLKEEEKN